MQKFLVSFLLNLISICSFGQQKTDAIKVIQKDTQRVTYTKAPTAANNKMTGTITPFLTPKKIALFSAIIPGLGQFHNKQYWKIGLIYAGVGTALYFAQDNLKNYNKYRRVYTERLNNGGNNVDEDLKTIRKNNLRIKQDRDYYRRNLDLTIVLTGAGYMMQIIDALVFAHLKGFDLSENISLNARPILMPQGDLGFGLVLNF